MMQYVKIMIKEFPEKLSGKLKCPWSKTSFKGENHYQNYPKTKIKPFTLLL
jgi:hypothetical protein